MLDNKPRRFLRVFFAMVSAFLSVVYVFTDRSADINSVSIALDAMNANNTGVTLTFAALSVIYYKIYQVEGKRLKTLAAVGGVVFSLCEVLGFNISHWDSMFRKNGNIISLMLDMMCLLGAFTVFNGALRALFFIIEKNKITRSGKCKWFDCNLRSFIITFGILVCLYSIYYVLFYPAISTWDSYYQIEQGMGFRQLTDENPFLHTLLMGSVIKLGTAIFGTIVHGIALYTVLQMLLVALAVSFMLAYLARRGINIWLRLITLAYFALHPVIASYSITTWKDIWISYFMLLYVILLVEIACNRENFFKSKWHIIMFILIVCGFLFTKNIGIYIFLLTLPFLWIYARKNYKQLIIITVACLLLFVLVRSVIIPQFGVTKGHVREAYSVPLQQIARTVTKHGDELSQEQKDIINEILPYDELPSLYVPKLSDNVKSELNEEAFSSNIGRYAKLWAELGLKHPKTYVESFLANTYGYWYPETKYWQISTSSYYDILYMYRDNGWNVYDENIDNYVADEAATARRDWVVNKYHALRDVPVISSVFSLAMYFWAAFIFMLICILKKKYSMLLPYTVVTAVLITCLISPVHAECRYAFLSIISLPVLASFVLQDDIDLTLKMGIENASLKNLSKKQRRAPKSEL